MAVSGEIGEASEPFVGERGSNSCRLLLEVQRADRNLRAVGVGAPPVLRIGIARRSDRLVDVGFDRCHLRRVEHVVEMEEPGLGEKVGEFLRVVVKAESTVEGERFAVEIAHDNRTGLMHRPAFAERTQRRLPMDPFVE